MNIGGKEIGKEEKEEEGIGDWEDEGNKIRRGKVNWGEEKEGERKIDGKG